MATVILGVILLVMAIACLVMGGFMPLFSIAFGFLFLYYLLVYGLIILAVRKQKTIYSYLAYILFFLPTIWSLWDFEGLFNFLLQGIHLDMK
ncbi:MAG: hypothetical protein AAGC43_10755 [Bacteroidota bacterium]